MGLTPLNAYERETVIIMNDEDEMASITTHQRRILTKLERNPAATKIEDLQHGRQPGGSFEIPKALISLRTKKTKRPGSGANLQAKIERK